MLRIKKWGWSIRIVVYSLILLSSICLLCSSGARRRFYTRFLLTFRSTGARTNFSFRHLLRLSILNEKVAQLEVSTKFPKCSGGALC
jgi:hypothetical protein